MDKLQLLNDSRMARLVFDQLGEYLKKQRADLLSRLIAATKTGPLDPQIYAKHLGGIEALEELEFILKKTILKGEKIERELLDADRK